MNHSIVCFYGILHFVMVKSKLGRFVKKWDKDCFLFWPLCTKIVRNKSRLTFFNEVLSKQRWNHFYEWKPNKCSPRPSRSQRSQIFIGNVNSRSLPQSVSNKTTVKINFVIRRSYKTKAYRSEAQNGPCLQNDPEFVPWRLTIT